jgi:integrase
LKATILKANLGLPSDQQIPHWTLYQLRHRYLTEMTERYDENIAALLAGHSDPKMVRRIYDHSQERRIKRLKQEQDENMDDSADLKSPHE